MPTLSLKTSAAEQRCRFPQDPFASIFGLLGERDVSLLMLLQGKA